VEGLQPQYREFRPGDVRHSQADISKARHLLGYEPTHEVRKGLEEALTWYVREFALADKAVVMSAQQKKRSR
jgi:UDP-N-acetylglucosamine 4-epimerase